MGYLNEADRFGSSMLGPSCDGHANGACPLQDGRGRIA